MMRNKIVLGLASAIALSGFAAEKPNVVVIIADDLGYADVGFHDEVAPDVCTPNLDKLAGNGVVFNWAYASSPVCSNSRLSLSTGRYAQRWGAYYYGDGGLPRSEFTIAEMMKEAGYRTMKVGKTHLNKGPKEHPMKHGFDHFLGFINHSWDFELLSKKDVAAYEAKKPGCTKKMNHCPIGPMIRDNKGRQSFENTTTTEVFAQESVAFIQQESDQPFYLQLEFNAVHTPLHRCPKSLQKKYGVPDRPFDRNAASWEYPLWDPAKQTFIEWYDDSCHVYETDPYGRKIYLAHLELMDQAIGRIMQTLEAKGIADNTILFFTSDNGGSAQSRANNGSLNGYKYTMMDGGIRVPMIMSWPGHQQAGLKSDALVTHRDLFATLSEVTGVAPKNPLDAESLLPVMNGSAKQVHDGPLLWDTGKGPYNWVVRDGDWQLVFFGNARKYKAYKLDEKGLVAGIDERSIAKGMKLFNMKEDPFQRNNLVDAHPERVAQMQQVYTKWRSGMADKIRGKNVK